MLVGDNNDDANANDDDNDVTYFPTISVFQTLRQPPKTSLTAIIFQ